MIGKITVENEQSVAKVPNKFLELRKERKNRIKNNCQTFTLFKVKT